MKNLLVKINAFAIFLLLLNSCGGSDSSTNQNLATLTTLPAEILDGTSLVLGGNITDNGGTDINERGVCWGTSNNPTVDGGNIDLDNVNQIGEYTLTIHNQFEPNTLYYARAFCQNGAGYAYGNTISFTTGELIATSNPKDILATQATLQGSISQASGNTSLVGFAYGTSHNPTVNGSSVFTNVMETTPYEIQISNLTPNTVYYVRAYTPSLTGAGYTYGVEKEFRTTGYFGPAGGYVAYDKGELTDGWRYMEIHPTTLSYNPASTTGSAWGNGGVYVSGTSSQIGTGLENTNLIASHVTQANCAAKLCQNLVLNGFSDWFLPSSGELLMISQSLLDADIFIGNSIWTSTQSDATYAKTVEYDYPPASYYLYDDEPKTTTNIEVLPVRRY